MAKANRDNELRIVRILNSPIDLVWNAYTQVEHQKHWWGPRGFTISTKSKDLSPGGQWIYTMHGPDGVDYPNIATYHVVEKNSKLIYDHGATENTPPLFRVEVTFEEVEKKTVMDMTMRFETPEMRKEIEIFIKQANGDSTWDRLGEYLEFIQNKKDIFIINRCFETNLSEMFNLWANPENFSRWMGPTGSQLDFLSVNVKVDGTSHYMMTSDTGEIMYGLIEYKEIDDSHKLVYLQSFCDENKNICKPPFAPIWPDKMKTTVFFTDEGDGNIRITLEWEIEGEATEEERKVFNAAKPGMTVGWNGSFDKLESCLKN